MEQITITLDGVSLEVKQGVCLEELLGGRGKESLCPVMTAVVGGRIRELNYQPAGGDEVRFLDISDPDGSRAYVRGLLHIFIQAVRDLFPEAKVDIQHSMNEGIYCEVHDREQLTPFSMKKIERRMHQISEADEPFVRHLISRDEAIELYEKEGQFDKARLLRFREDKKFKVYSCGSVSDYFYGMDMKD